MLNVFILMISTGITDGELQMAEPHEDEKLFTIEQCQTEADVLNSASTDNSYLFCLDYQEAAWNQTWYGN